MLHMCDLPVLQFWNACKRRAQETEIKSKSWEHYFIIGGHFQIFSSPKTRFAMRINILISWKCETTKKSLASRDVCESHFLLPTKKKSFFHNNTKRMFFVRSTVPYTSTHIDAHIHLQWLRFPTLHNTIIIRFVSFRSVSLRHSS